MRSTRIKLPPLSSRSCRFPHREWEWEWNGREKNSTQDGVCVISRRVQFWDKKGGGGYLVPFGVWKLIKGKGPGAPRNEAELPQLHHSGGGRGRKARVRHDWIPEKEISRWRKAMEETLWGGNRLISRGLGGGGPFYAPPNRSVTEIRKRRPFHDCFWTTIERKRQWTFTSFSPLIYLPLKKKHI